MNADAHDIAGRAARMTAILLAAAVWVGCAGGSPTLQQRHIREKLELRLHLALSQDSTEQLGAYIRVIVRMREEPSAAQLDSLGRRGKVHSSLRQFVTMTVATSRLAFLADYKPVERIELDLADAPPPRRR